MISYLRTRKPKCPLLTTATTTETAIAIAGNRRGGKEEGLNLVFLL